MWSIFIRLYSNEVSFVQRVIVNSNEFVIAKHVGIVAFSMVSPSCDACDDHSKRAWVKSFEQVHFLASFSTLHFNASVLRRSISIPGFGVVP
jgi:hypothetical protein